MRNAFLLFLIFTTMITAEDLNSSQKSQLKTANGYLEKAEKATHVSIMKNYVRYAKSIVESLVNSKPDNEQVKNLQQRFQNIQQKITVADVESKLKFSLRGVQSRISKYKSPTQVPDWQKSYLTSSLQTIQQQVQTLKDANGNASLIQEGEKAISSIKYLLGQQQPQQQKQPQQQQPIKVTAAQKYNIQKAAYYLNRAGRSTNVSARKQQLKNALGYLQQLQQQIPQEQNVKKLTEFYDKLLATVTPKQNTAQNNTQNQNQNNSQNTPKGLNPQQKSDLRQANYYIDRARSFSSPASRKRQLAYADGFIKRLQSVRENAEVQEMLNKYNELAKANTTPPQNTVQNNTQNQNQNNNPNTPKELNPQQKNDLRQAYYYINRARGYSDVASRKSQLRYVDGFIKRLQSVRDNVEVKKMLAAYNELANAAPQNTNTQTTQQNQQTQQPSAAEKNAVSRLRSTFSFAKRHINQGLQIQKEIQSGQKVSSQRFSYLLQQLEQKMKEATPHIEVLSKNAKNYPEQIAKFTQLVDVTEFLQKSLKEIKAKELNRSVENSLAWSRGYMKEVETTLKNYATQITSSRSPEDTLRSIMRQIDFRLNKIAETLQQEKRSYADHPIFQKAEQRYVSLVQQYKKTIPEMKVVVIIQQSLLLGKSADESRESAKQFSHFSENTSFKDALKKYQQAIDIIQPFAEAPYFKKLIAQHQSSAQKTRKLAVEKSIQAALQATEKDYLNWILPNVKWAEEYAGNSPELKKYVEEQQIKVVEKACQAAFKDTKSMDKNFSYWNSKKWEHIVALAKRNEKNRAAVVKYSSPLGKQKLEMLFSVLQAKEMDPEEQQKTAQNTYEAVKSFAEMDNNFAAEFKQKQAQIDALIQQNIQAIEQKKLEAEKQARIAKENFENSLSGEQSVVYKEWKEEYPTEREEKPKYTRWLYVKKKSKYVNEHHTYLFDAAGKLTKKLVEERGGGEVHDWLFHKFHNSTTYTSIASVYSSGKVYGYHKGSWTQIAEFKDNGKVYGYRDDSWMHIGEFREDGRIWGYRGSSWSHVATIEEKAVRGYHGSSSWGVIAEFRDNGKVYGYNLKGDWGQISMKIASRKYAIATIVFIINRRNPYMYK
ncbi:hypothetical protein [Candidatus Uabimicrobium amorphum]|uniref:Uncharacterized protein n=1 Tax=Uabimicrobium amorphum TaxID=2596890 RepID=A0A5S9IPD5_UABAM|nr:hypothetical protein [Candidatus Uabimicrobium amorphum]BBM85434.1 hypothetical protein UABAM_03801 [Candidatus Uabimicrobium amorphum]